MGTTIFFGIVIACVVITLAVGLCTHCFWDESENGSYIYISDIFSRRWFRVLSTFLFGMWVFLNGCIGAIMLFVKEGALVEYVDIHTPPMRQIYIALSVCVCSLMLITTLLYFFKLRVRIEKNTQATENGRKLALRLSLFGASFCMIALAAFGTLGVMGIYDISKNKDVFLILAIITGIAVIVPVVICVFLRIRIVKDTETFEVGTGYVLRDYRLMPYGRILIFDTQRFFWGRLYWIRASRDEDEKVKKYIVTPSLLEDVISAEEKTDVCDLIEEEPLSEDSRINYRFLGGRTLW